MNRIPPTAEIIDAAKFLLAPAAVSVVAVFVVFGLLAMVVAKKCDFDWRRAMPAVFVLAIAASLLTVNHFRDNPFPWVPEGKWWHFGGASIAACFLVELFCQMIPSRSVAFLLRGLTAGIIAHFIVPAAWQVEARWWVPFVALWLAVSWAIVAEIAKRQSGGALAFAGSIFAGGAGVVLLHARSLGLSDLAIALAIGLFLLALFAWIFDRPAIVHVIIILQSSVVNHTVTVGSRQLSVVSHRWSVANPSVVSLRFQCREEARGGAILGRLPSCRVLRVKRSGL